jgi:class 3 adenylate cyclase
LRSSVETFAEVELVGELTLKGIARPVAAWNLVRNRE